MEDNINNKGVIQIIEFIKKVYDYLITKIILIILVVINLLLLINYFSNYIKVNEAQESLYWLFSASAQSIATFVAFLIAGYSLVYNIMDNLEQEDDSIGELHFDIKQGYYSKIKVISYLTGITIIFNLLMLFLNRYDFIFKNNLVVITVLLSITTIILGLRFVIKIIDPNKYKKAAERIIKKDGFEVTGDKVDKADFFNLFLKLKNRLREIIKIKQLEVKSVYENDIPGFREMIDSLLYNELIDKKLYEELKKVGQYRNLVYHGHIDKVDQGMVNKLKRALEEINNLYDSISEE